MKPKSSFLIQFAFIILLLSCGGVIGNIEKYPFPNVEAKVVKH
jgi:hypothetical protein